MKSDIRERRKECLQRALRGQKTSTWVRVISDKYDCAERTVWDDWRRRNDWIPEIYSEADVVDAAKEFMVHLSQVREEAWKVYYQTEDGPNAKIGALKLVKDVVSEQVGKLQSLGELHKESEEFDIKTETGLAEKDKYLVEGLMEAIADLEIGDGGIE